MDRQLYHQKRPFGIDIHASFHPRRIGVIDYHGAHRNYAREALGGINLARPRGREATNNLRRITRETSTRTSRAKWPPKFVKQSLRERLPGESAPNVTTQRLTTRFRNCSLPSFLERRLPGQYPLATAIWNSPIQTVGDGPTHDINDLSSGEKGFCSDTYALATQHIPKYSVVLLDEPELHLNPALVRGLPQFYYKLWVRTG